MSKTTDDIEEYDGCLYHGIRFDTINRLESIFQTGYILPGNKIKRLFISYDGIEKSLYISNLDDDNCNKGKYISVMPYTDSVEFNTFIRENLFFVIKGPINVIKTTRVSYDEYRNLKNSNDNYSYALNEYFVKDDIPLDNVIFIGIDSSHFNGDYDKMIMDVINLINVYKIDIPFVDIRTNREIYRLNQKQL